MLEPLDERKLNALVYGGGNIDCRHFKSAREFLKEDKNLPDGLYCLLNAWDVFSPRRHNDLEEYDKGNEKWHLYFYNSPFRTLRLRPGADGTVDIYSYQRFLKSFEQLFDRPHEWQAMVKWIWEYGHQRQKARSIPQLDPQRLSALMQHSENDYGDDQSLYELMHTSWHLLKTKYMSKGVLNLLMAFAFCEPQLSLDRSSNFHEETGYERWQISFQDPLFNSLRINSGTAEGVVDVYAPSKRPRSFQMTDEPSSWQALLDFIWDYGNKQNIDGKIFTARPSSKSRTRSQSKQQRAKKPLLHRVLRTAGFKAQRETATKTNRLTLDPEEGDAALHPAYVGPPPQRLALRVKDPNDQMVIESSYKDKIDDQGKKGFEAAVDAGGVNESTAPLEDGYDGGI